MYQDITALRPFSPLSIIRTVSRGIVKLHLNFFNKKGLAPKSR